MLSFPSTQFLHSAELYISDIRPLKDLIAPVSLVLFLFFLFSLYCHESFVNIWNFNTHLLSFVVFAVIFSDVLRGVDLQSFFLAIQYTVVYSHITVIAFHSA